MSLGVHRPQQLLYTHEQDGAPVVEVWFVAGRGHRTDPLRVEVLGDLDPAAIVPVARALAQLTDRHGPHLHLRFDPSALLSREALVELGRLEQRMAERDGELVLDLGGTTEPTSRAMTRCADEPTPNHVPAVDIQTVHENGIVVLRLSGELDSANADAFYQVLRGDTRHHPRPLVLDMSGVSFIDSTILSRLLQLRSESSDVSSSVIVRNPSPVVRRVLQITGLDELFGLS